MNNNKKIIAFTENHLGGGSNRYFIDAINSLVDPANQITVCSNNRAFSNNEKIRFSEKVLYNPIPIYNLFTIYLSWGIYHKKYWKLSKLVLLALTPIFFLLNLFNYGKILLRHNPDILFIISGGFPGPHSTFILSLLAKFLKKKIVVVIVSEPVPRTFLHRGYIFLAKKLWDTIIVNTTSIKTKLAEQGIAEGKIHIVFNGIEIPKKDGSSLYDTIKTIGYVGRIDQQKGLQYLIEGFAACVKKYPDLRLLIAGSGPFKDDLLNQISKLHLQSSIKIVGFVENVYDFFKDIDVFVFPSLHEGLPYSVMEAMNAQLPIITTNVGGITELITNGKEGLVVNAKSSEEIAIAIERLIREPAFAQQLSVSACNKVGTMFSMEKMKSRLEYVLFSN